jgi:hypothetical protein
LVLVDEAAQVLPFRMRLVMAGTVGTHRFRTLLRKAAEEVAEPIIDLALAVDQEAEEGATQAPPEPCRQEPRDKVTRVELPQPLMKETALVVEEALAGLAKMVKSVATEDQESRIR